MKNKKQYMRNNIPLEAIKIVFRICKSDCIKMLIVQMLFSLFPLFLGIIVKRLINNLQMINIGYTLFYCLFYGVVFFLQKFCQILFYHYYVVYKVMPNFERQVKLELFSYSDTMTIEEFQNAEFVNGSQRAKNASINLFRLYQAYVEVIGTIMSCIFIGVAGLVICWQMVIFLLIIVLSVVLENFERIKVETEDFYQRTQVDKEYDENIDFILNPVKFKEIRVLNIFSFVSCKVKDSWNYLYNKKENKNIKILKISLIFGFITCFSKIFAFMILFLSYKNNMINLGDIAFAMISFVNISDMIDEIFNVQSYISQFTNLVVPFFEYKKRAKNKGKKEFKELIRKIELKNVSYRYLNQTENAISNINLKINAGEKIVIVGENGSGKTTLLKIISGLLSPKSGNVFYNEKRSSEYKERDVLNSFTIVPQMINLYPISLYENITFGNGLNTLNISEEFLQLRLDNLYCKMHKIVGKMFGGDEYSGGEKQKIGIVRAKNKDANCVLLDEATSSIDAIQEDEIFERLCNYLESKTGIIVSHKLSYAKIADKIIVLHKGKIIEQGSHEELIQKNGVYKEMWQIQTRGYLN